MRLLDNYLGQLEVLVDRIRAAAAHPAEQRVQAAQFEKLSPEVETLLAVVKSLPKVKDPISWRLSVLGRLDGIQEKSLDVKDMLRLYSVQAYLIRSVNEDVHDMIKSSRSSVVLFTAVGLVAGIIGEFFAMFGILETDAAFYVVPASFASIWILMMMLAHFGWNRIKINLRIDKSSDHYETWHGVSGLLFALGLVGGYLLISFLTIATYK